jgi:NAD(P)-dependent dehydrogenase (short-subunit alcohol dehydrogenase family)
MAGRLDGKTAVITGGASGIGEATVRLFVEEGARVVVADIQDDAGQALAAELGDGVLYQHTDVTKGESVGAAVTRAVDAWGKLSVMYNNAGAMVGRGSILEMPDSEVDKALGLLFKSVFYGVREAGKAMKLTGGGSIVSTASIAGLTPGGGPHLYATAKAAVVYFTKSVSLELGEHDIRVNCVCPGGIATPLVAQALGASNEDLAVIHEGMAGRQAISRAGSPLDVARAVLWLASDESDYIVGQEIAVDGGERFGPKWSEWIMS